MTKRKPSQGARKTETLTLRLDPKAKFTIDLLSRTRRQSITTVIESAIDEMAYDQDVDTPEGKWTLGSAVTEVWSTDEAVRFLRMCEFMPGLLTHEEQRLWETIKASPAFLANERSTVTTSREVKGVGRLDITVVRVYWNDLLKHVEQNRDSRTIVPFKSTMLPLDPPL